MAHTYVTRRYVSGKLVSAEQFNAERDVVKGEDEEVITRPERPILASMTLSEGLVQAAAAAERAKEEAAARVKVNKAKKEKIAEREARRAANIAAAEGRRVAANERLAAARAAVEATQKRIAASQKPRNDPAWQEVKARLAGVDQQPHR